MPVLLVIGCLAALTPAATAQTTWYVDDNAPADPAPGDPTISDPLEDGSAAHPFDAIQEGIDAAAVGDEVVIADGVYTGFGNKDLDFGGKDITVRSASGDPSTCIIDCEGEGRGFYFHSGETAAAMVTGLTITGGFADGAGLCCFYSSPTFNHCIIEGNTAYEYGGGVYCRYDSDPTFNNCTIRDNDLDHGMGTSGGGGVCCRTNSNPTFNGCTISGNRLTNGGNGGGIFCRNSSPTFDHCDISDNIGTGVNCRDNSNPILIACTIHTNTTRLGGGVSCDGSNPILSNCSIEGNRATEYGGGIYCVGDSSPMIHNCTIRDNYSTGIGGGVYCGVVSSPSLSNCLISGNTGVNGGGGVMCENGGGPTLHNSIIWSNAPFAIHSSGGELTVTYCAVEGGWPGTGNLDVNLHVA